MTSMEENDNFEGENSGLMAFSVRVKLQKTKISTRSNVIEF